MARVKKDTPVDLSKPQELTAGLIDRLSCPVGLKQAFLKDSKAPGFRVRVTAGGAKSFVFESKLNRENIRITIGDVRAWTIEAARAESNKYRVMLDQGVDPRAQRSEDAAQSAARASEQATRNLTVGELWPQYLAEGKPKRKDQWKPGYKKDLILISLPGGEPKKRGAGLTKPGPLYPLMGLTLGSVNEDALLTWFQQEAVRGKAQAARALMMFRGFLRWCAINPAYRSYVDHQAGGAPALRDAMPQNKRRTDGLETAQVASWWSGVEQLSNHTIAVYLKALLLTGARREEMAKLTWSNVDFRWQKVISADKYEATRVYPLTPHLAGLLSSLPRVNKYVFASTGQSGHLVDARASHEKALLHAGIEHLTFHGLRRSYMRLARQVVPAGVPAQISGHKPSATAEGYTVLSLDDLRPYAVIAESHIIKLAGVAPVLPEISQAGSPASVAS